MHAKRTHRSGKSAMVETLESRRLLSGPAVVINYLDSNVTPPTTPYESQPSNGGTISWMTGVPLHVTSVAAGGQSGTTFSEFSDYETNPNHAIEAEWQWNFDVTDVDSSEITYDKLNGFNAAHIYNETGTYTLTLTVTDENGNPTTETIYVDVAAVANFDPSSSNYKGTVYVSESGGGDGSSSTDPMDLATLESRLSGGSDYALDPIPSDSQILFKNGDTFTLDSTFSTLDITQSNLKISSWYSVDADDPAPIFNNTAPYSEGNPTAIFSTSSSSVNVVISNLDFEANNGTPGPKGESANTTYVFEPAGVNLAVLNCAFTQFDNESDFVNATADSGDGLYLQSNNVDDTSSDVLGYFLFDWNIGDAVVIDNTVNADTAGHDGLIRISVDFGISPAQGILIDGNQLTNSGPGDETTEGGASIRLLGGSYAWVANNNLYSPTTNTIDVGAIAEAPPVAGASFDDAVIEDNTSNGGVWINPGCSELMFRNNIFTQNSWSASTGIFLLKGNGIYSARYDSNPNDLENVEFDMSNIFILNNTGIASSGGFLDLAGPASNIYVMNNLLQSATGASLSEPPIYLDDFGSGDILSSFADIGGNVWADPNSEEAVNIQENGVNGWWYYENLTGTTTTDSLTYQLASDFHGDTYNLELDVPTVPGYLFPTASLISSVTFTVSGTDTNSITFDPQTEAGEAVPWNGVTLSPNDTITITTSSSSGFFPTFVINGKSNDVDEYGSPFTLSVVDSSWSGIEDWNHVTNYEDQCWWNTKLSTLFHTSDTFGYVDLTSGDIPTSEIGTDSPVPGVFGDYYGKPRPATSWTAGAVEPDLDLSNAGYIWLQSNSDDTLSVYDGASAPEGYFNFALPFAAFEAISLQSGTGTHFTIINLSAATPSGDMTYTDNGGNDDLSFNSGISPVWQVNVEGGASLSVFDGDEDGTAASPASIAVDSLQLDNGSTVTIGVRTIQYIDLSANAIDLGSGGGDNFGKLDVGHNTLFTNDANLTDIVAYLTSGFDGGSWNGNGIMSSIAADDNEYGPGGTALGYFDNTTTDEIEIRYTFVGDANLDGVVNATDLAMISSTGTNWQTGDFNYDGHVNADDYSDFEYGDAVQDDGKLDGSTTFDSADVAMFAAAQTESESAWEAQYPDGDYLAGDINGDGVVNSDEGFNQIAADNGLAGYVNPIYGVDGISLTSISDPVHLNAMAIDNQGRTVAVGQVYDNEMNLQDIAGRIGFSNCACLAA